MLMATLLAVLIDGCPPPSLGSISFTAKEQANLKNLMPCTWRPVIQVPSLQFSFVRDAQEPGNGSVGMALCIAH